MLLLCAKHIGTKGGGKPASRGGLELPMKRVCRRARGCSGIGWRLSDRSVGQRAILDEPRCAALGHASEQLQDLEPEQGDERLGAGIGQVGPPALRRVPNTPSSLMPTMVRIWMAWVRASSAIAWSRSARVRPCSGSRASGSGPWARKADSPGVWVCRSLLRLRRRCGQLSHFTAHERTRDFFPIIG